MMVERKTTVWLHFPRISSRMVLHVRIPSFSPHSWVLYYDMGAQQSYVKCGNSSLERQPIYLLKWVAIHTGPTSTETVTPPLQQSQRPCCRPIRPSEAVDATAHRPTIAASGDSYKPLPASQDSNSTVPNIEVVSFWGIATI